MAIRGWMLSLMVLVASVTATNLTAATWNGSAGNNDWSDPANWDTNDVPDTAGEDAIFDTVSPLGNAITITPATVGMIQVNTGRTITFTITAALSVNGAAWGIDVQTGATATFTAASALVMDVANDVRTQGTGSLTFGANIVLAFTQGSPGFNVAGGSTLNVQGDFLATLSSSISIDNNPTASVTFNNFQLGDGVTGSIFGITSSDPAAAALISITGTLDIDDNSGFDEDDVNPYELRISGATIDFNSATGVVMDLELGHVNFIRTGTTTITGGTAATPFTCNDYTVASGTTVVYDATFAAAFIWIGYLDGVVSVNGTLNVGSMEVQFGGDLALGPSGAFTQSGTPGDLTFEDGGSGDNNYIILGDWTFAGPVFFTGGEWLVADGSTVIFNGSNVTINGGGSFGMAQDGATASTGSTITINGTFRVDVAGGFVLGEGIINFADNLDLGDTLDVDFVTLAPNLANDFATEIHLIGGAQTIGFGPGGSMFFVTSVQPATRVTHSAGLMALGGPLDVSGATGAGTAWNSAAQTIRLGGLYYVASGNIVTGDLDVVINTLQFFEIVAASPGQRTEFVVTSTGSGEFNIGSITMVGDTNAATGGEDNGSNLIFRNAVVNVTFDLTLFDGNNGGNGATLALDNAVLSSNNVLVGLGAAADATEGPELRVTDSTLLITGTLAGDVFSRLQFFDSTIDSGDNLAYAINVSANAEELVFLRSTVTCDAAADVDIDIGGSSIYLLSSTFEHYDIDGLEIKAGSTITAFSECVFQNGHASGSHVTLNGLANATKLNCDENKFDETTGAAGFEMVYLLAAGNALHFRTFTDFGLGAAAIDATLAESRDNDGTGATEVTWEVLASNLHLASAASQPAGLVTEDTTTNQTAYRFTLTATGASSTVTQMRFEIFGEGNLVDADIVSATLYEDLDANGRFDTGEQLGAGSLNQTVTGTAVTFNITGGVVTTAAPRTWSVAITFAAAADDESGFVTVQCIPPTGITVTEIATTTVTGLPLFAESIYVSGDLDHLVILTQPSNTVVNSTIVPAVEIELRDVNGNLVLGQSIDVTVAKQTGPGALSGTLTVTSDPDTGVATFGDLALDTAGTGFVLRFDTAVTAFVDSNSFDITAATAVLTLDEAGSAAGLITDTVANQSAFSFTLDATLAGVTVTSLEFDLTLGGSLTAGDVVSATLFEDADADGQYDAGEELDAGSLNEAVVAGGVTFNLGAGEAIAVGTTRTWIVAVTFAGGAADVAGTLRLVLAAGNVTVTSGSVSVLGLPLDSGAIGVTGTVAALVIITGPSDEQEDTAISPAVVIELQDLGGNAVLGRSFNVTANIQSGGTAGAVLGGTLTVASSGTTGRANFADLTFDLPGTGYILRFTSGAIFVDSAAFNITAAPVPPKKKGGGGGGCSAEGGSAGWAAFAALLAALSLGAVARLRHNSSAR